MRRIAAAFAPVVSAHPALAHAGQATMQDSFTAGVLHPVLGADHLLAMVAIGLLAAALGGSARLLLPAAFVVTMALGLLLGVDGIALPLMEPMILASVLILGAVLALAVRPALPVMVAMAAVFGLFHGDAHAAAMGAVAFLPFAAGVLTATALLHAAGIVLAALMGSRPGNLPLRFLGAGLGLGGLALGLG